MYLGYLAVTFKSKNGHIKFDETRIRRYVEKYKH